MVAVAPRRIVCERERERGREGWSKVKSNGAVAKMVKSKRKENVNAANDNTGW